MIKKFAHTIQLSENDCGIACIMSILKYYKYNIDYVKIRNLIDESNGVNISSIKNFFQNQNFESKIFKVNNSLKKEKFLKLSEANFPCILLIEHKYSNHYVVLFRILKNEKCIINERLGEY